MLVLLILARPHVATAIAEKPGAQGRRKTLNVGTTAARTSDRVDASVHDCIQETRFVTLSSLASKPRWSHRAKGGDAWAQVFLTAL